MKPLIRKSWHTLTEAADYLTQSTEGGPVTVTDVLQLALDGDLTISILVTEESEAEFRFAQVKPRHELTEDEEREIVEDRDNWPENPLEEETRPATGSAEPRAALFTKISGVGCCMTIRQPVPLAGFSPEPPQPERRHLLTIC